MQTFLPYANFIQTAEVLDYRRLGKQRVECYQILKVLKGESTSKAWQNHPAVQMWKGHENALVIYGVAICNEWLSRGYKDTCEGKIAAFYDLKKPCTMPSFIGREDFHKAHRSNLLRKNKDYYSQYFNESDDLPYIWK